MQTLQHLNKVRHIKPQFRRVFKMTECTIQITNISYMKFSFQSLGDFFSLEAAETGFLVAFTPL